MDHPDKLNRIEDRVLLLAPTARDSQIAQRLLSEARVPCRACETLEQLCAELATGAGALILPEEALLPERVTQLVKQLTMQPAWSDIPVILLTQDGADGPLSSFALQHLGNVMLVDRPVRINTLISVIRSALRARRRQYQVREHLAERERSEESLRDADRRKDEFLATLAHELRNPLAPVRNAVQILRQKGSQDAEGRWCQEVIERQVEHLTRLIDDLLDISRITRNKLELRKEVVELKDVVAAAIEMSRPLIEQSKHRLSVTMPEERMCLDADLVRLAQVLMNLLNNAAKYTEPGGEITLTAERKGDEAVICVHDTGLGIPSEKIPYLFQMFYQVERSINRSEGGLGIGLALVRRLVEMHGGTVEATSEGLGHGSRFTLRLPLIPLSSIPPDDCKSSQDPSTARPQRVLVVDDNRDAADSLSIILRKFGHEVHTAYDGQQAVEFAEDLRPQLILLDIGMPRMNGYEAARRIREQPWGKELTLVALTGWGQDNDRELTRQAGFNHHFVKPVEVASLSQLFLQRP